MAAPPPPQAMKVGKDLITSISSNKDEEIIKSFNAVEAALISKVISAKVLFSQAPMPLVFGILSSKNPKVVEAAVRVLTKVFESKEGTTLLESPQLSKPLLDGLSHPNEKVRVMTSGQVQRLISTSSTYSTALPSQPMWDALFNSLSDESIGVLKNISDCFVSFATSSASNTKVFFGKDTIKRFTKHMTSSSETVKFRILDLFSELATHAELFDSCVKSGILQTVTKHLDSDDLLLQLNVVELLSKIATTAAGAAFLSKSGTLGSLYKILKSNKSDPLLGSSVIRFLGVISTTEKGSTILKAKPFLDELFKRLASDSTPDDIIQDVITSMGSIGSTPTGLAMITSSKNLPLYSQSLLSDKPVLRVAAQHSFAQMLLSPNNKGSKEVEGLKKVLAAATSDNFMVEVDRLLKAPFSDTRYAIYHVLQGLGSHVFGAELLLSHGGFYEFLMDRRTEHEKAGKEWKFSVVESIAMGPGAASMDPKILKNLKVYLRQGPFYVETETAVQVQDSTA